MRLLEQACEGPLGRAEEAPQVLRLSCPYFYYGLCDVA
jgi:hypothetical protein